MISVVYLAFHFPQLPVAVFIFTQGFIPASNYSENSYFNLTWDDTSK